MSLDIKQMMQIKMAYDGERQKVLSQNVANIDTPGFRARDLKELDFRNVLAAETRHVPMAITASGHMHAGMRGGNRFRTEELGDPFEYTPTGGTVVLEQQMMKISQNATDYQMVTSLYRKVGGMFRIALGVQQQ